LVPKTPKKYLSKYKLLIVLVLVVIITPAIIEIINNQSPKSQPPITTPTSNISVRSIESNRDVISNNSVVTLTVNATYVNGSDISLSYSQFYLQLFTLRISVQDLDGKTYPINNGTFQLGTTQKTYIFHLTFTFPTLGFNGMDISNTDYYLGFNGTANVQFLPWYQ
jgi:hypothetical protein